MSRCCSFSSVLYKHVLGDKDTFGFAFAMAGKLHEMYAVAVPPAAAFKHEVRSAGTHCGLVNAVDFCERSQLCCKSWSPAY